jgi:hypothetical protein
MRAGSLLRCSVAAAIETIGGYIFRLGMILSENRLPLFGIMP